MRLEKINDKQVRCVISNQDLSAHHLTVKELRYGSPETVSLFKEILAKAVEEYRFNEEGLPIMIEAVPMGNEGLLLIVTAIEDAEELDPHFATFTEGLAADNPAQGAVHFPNISPDEKGPMGCVFKLKDMDQVLDFVKTVPAGIPSDLYKKEGQYYLTLERTPRMDTKAFSILMNSLMESGEFVKLNYAVFGKLKEHEKPVMKDPVGKLKNVNL